ncbi:MAG: hypothetical protein NTV00_03630 [Methylococcales bacterium]|nr:hypothetical protein [Methylococcales bacterium]
MKKIACIALLTLSPLAAQAACNIVPLTTDQLNVTRISGEIIAGGSSCSYSGHVVDFYSFEAKAGDVLQHSGSYYNLDLMTPDEKVLAWPGKVILPATGVYKIAINASTSNRDGIGRYTLELRSSAPTQTTTINPSTRTCKVVALTTAQLNGTRITGELIVGGPPCQDFGSTVDYYSFQANTGDILERSAGSYYVVDLQGPDGTSLGWPDKVILPASGVYKIAINASNSNRDGMGSYYLEIKKSSPAQPAPIATCPSDTYNNGKLTINSVEVPNGVGGMLKYKASMTLQALSNPLVFTVDQTTPLQ